MNLEKVKKGVKLILEALDDDENRPGLSGTPERMAKMFEELFSGLTTNLADIIKPIEGEKHDEMIMIKNIPFYSMCEHHFLPFIGKASIAYIPNEGRIAGIGDLTKALEVLARRPQIQERLTSQLADAITECLRPKGTMVVIEAEHLCMSMRGIKKPNCDVVTSAVRGAFRNKESTRLEMLTLMKDQ